MPAAQKRNVSIHISSLLTDAVNVSAIQKSASSASLHNMAEAAARKVWPFRPAKGKQRASSNAEHAPRMTPIKEDTELIVDPPKEFQKSFSASEASTAPSQNPQPDANLGLDVEAAAFQPGAPQHPMQPGVAFSLVRRQRSHTEPKGKSRTFLGARDLGAYTEEPTRSMSEWEYLMGPAPSAKELSRREMRQIQLGREDAWLLLLQSSRERTEEPIETAAGHLLFDLEQHFYPCDALMLRNQTPELTIRDEAMLEEAARLIALEKDDLDFIAEQAKVADARRKRRSGRKTF